MNREPNRARSYHATSCITLLLALAGLVSSPALAQDPSPEEIGLAIAYEAAARNDGFGNFTANLTMILRNRQGQESRRQIRFKVLEVEGDGDKSLFVFDQPRDVQGTALLTHGHLTAQDDQWLYLPALKRVKRISSSTRTGSFMGSEFSYEDMSNPEVEKYTYRFLREEPCGELTCTVNEQVPVDTKSSYSRQLVWQDKEHLRTWMVHYYDRKSSHLKTLVFAGYQQYLDRYWRAGEMTMENHLTGKSTVLNWTDLEFGTDLGDRDFSQAALRRVR
ncbi:MAG: outer membrane lipoprotein-sorting protein [Gammaproteobacteria bacterium]|nr:outer membrane lipoprotein-sorting protein [Gammaproteobacteria bacterium]